LQRQLPGSHLPRHSEGQVEPSIINLQGPSLDLLLALRLQPERSLGEQHRYPVRSEPGRTRQDCQAVDQEVRHVGDLEAAVDHSSRPALVVETWVGGE